MPTTIAPVVQNSSPQPATTLAPPVTTPATLPPPVAGSKTPAKTSKTSSDESRTVTTDGLAVLMSSLDYRDSKGRFDFDACALSYDLGNLINTERGNAWPSLATLCQKIGISNTKFIQRIIASPGFRAHWRVKARPNRSSNSYEPVLKRAPGGLKAALETRRNTDASADLPTRLNASAGFTPDPRSPRKRQEIEAVDAELESWTIPGTFAYLDRFLDPEMSPAEKVQATGLGHSDLFTFVVGGLVFESNQVRGFALKIAHLWHYTTGWASVAPSYFTEELGWSDSRISELNKALIRSGLFRIDQDEATHQNVYTYTPLLLAQATAYWALRALKTESGEPSGYRIALVSVNPSIGGIIAANAEVLGINDQIGTPGSSAENPSSPLGSTFARDKGDGTEPDRPRIHREAPQILAKREARLAPLRALMATQSAKEAKKAAKEEHKRMTHIGFNPSSATVYEEGI